MTMLTELRNRGIADALIVCCDGLKGLPDAIRVTSPNATVQTCAVHMVRNSLRLRVEDLLQRVTHAPAEHLDRIWTVEKTEVENRKISNCHCSSCRDSQNAIVKPPSTINTALFTTATLPSSRFIPLQISSRCMPR